MAMARPICIKKSVSFSWVIILTRLVFFIRRLKYGWISDFIHQNSLSISSNIISFDRSFCVESSFGIGMTLTLGKRFFPFKGIQFCLLKDSVDEELFCSIYPPISTSFPGLTECIFVDHNYLPLCIWTIALALRMISILAVLEVSWIRRSSELVFWLWVFHPWFFFVLKASLNVLLIFSVVLMLDPAFSAAVTTDVQQETAKTRYKIIVGTERHEDTSDLADILRIHTYIHIYIHTYIHTNIHRHMQTYTHTYIDTYIHTHIHTHIHTYIHTCIHTYVHTHTDTLKHIHIHTHKYNRYTDTHTHIHTHIQTYINKSKQYNVEQQHLLAKTQWTLHTEIVSLLLISSNLTTG